MSLAVSSRFWEKHFISFVLLVFLSNFQEMFQRAGWRRNFIFSSVKLELIGKGHCLDGDLSAFIEVLHLAMAASCFCFRRAKSKAYEPAVPNSFRRRTDSGLSTDSNRSRLIRGGSDVQQYREENGAITFESANGKVTVIPDARIPLTPRQSYLLIQNWKTISRRTAFTGLTMLVR